MKSPKTSDEPIAAPADEAFLERWSRRKAEARTGTGESANGQPDSGPPAETPAPATPPELPDLDSLDAESDYSAFLAPGVDEMLRRKALRKLFRSPKFNVCDGLDDYCEDFTQFEALGDIVTADMRYQMERAARKAQQLLEDAGAERAPDESVAATTAPAEGPARQQGEVEAKEAHGDDHEPA